jgi:hypothetical protein
MYLGNTRPDIFYVVSALSQFMSQPRQTHWIAAKHVLRYLRGTVGHGLRLQGYTDSDWAGSAMDRKSTSGCCFNLGSSMVSWCSRKHTFVALSTAKAEYNILDMVQRKAVLVQYLPADVLTKALIGTKFEYFRDRLSVAENASLAEREC